MNKDLRNLSPLGFFDVKNNSWYKLEKFEVLDGLITDISYTLTDPDDLRYFMLPGFIDAHCHILENPYDDNRDLVSIAYINALVAVNHGITTVRDLGGRGYKAIEISKILSKYTLAHILTSGCYFTVPRGHCSERGAIEVSTLDDFKNGIKFLLCNDIRYCKILNSDDGFDYSLLCQMIEYAHNHGMIVSTHAYTEKAATEAVLAGTDTLEHAGNYSDKLLELIKEKNIIVIPTYVAAVDSTPENSSFLKDVNNAVLTEWLNGENLVIPKLFQRDIQVGLGTDAGFLGTPFDSLMREIELLHTRFDISIQRLLYSANITTPVALAVGDKLGRIAQGYNADFLIYQNNPLSSFDVLKAPIQIWISGKRVDNQAGNYIKIVKLTKDHIPLISENLRNYYFDCAELDDFWTDDEMRIWIESDNDYCTGAFLKNELVGFSLTHYHKAVNKVHLENIFVNRMYRNQGIGSRLLFDVIAHYKSLSKKKIRFVGLVDVTNKSALSVLDKREFTKGHPMHWMQLNSYENY